MRLFGPDRDERSSSGDPEEFRLTLGEHLDELRSRILRIIVFLVAGWVIGWYLEPWVYETLNTLARKNMELPPGVDYKEPFKAVMDPFMLKLKLSFFVGLILVFPFCILQVWGFVSPGLKDNEKRPMRVVAPISVVLFGLGVLGCWIILPSAFAWFASWLYDFPGTVLYPEPGTMVFFILKMLLAFGLGFQLPLLVFFMAKIGIISPHTLKMYWRQATVIIFFGAAAITPSSDIFSMMMMAIPLTLLFFLSMMAVQISEKKKNKALQDVEDAA